MKKLTLIILILFVVPILTINLYAQPTSGLSAYYPFNGNASDASGNGNNGSVSGATLTADRYANSNKAYSFDGTNDGITISTTSNLNNTFAGSHTISVWIKLDSEPTILKFVVDACKPGAGGELGDQRGIRFTSYTTRPTFKWVTTSASYQVHSSQGLTTGNWHHVVGVFNGSSGKIYVDNSLRGSSSSSGSGTPIDRMKIGTISAGGSDPGWFPGDLDDIRIYNRALSSSEIEELYYEGEAVNTPNTPTGSSSGKVGQSMSFSTGGSSCNLGHSVEYQFDWGDGNYSSWGSSSQSYKYNNIGTYSIKARARCQSHTSVVSGWSGGKSITISGHSLSISISPSGAGSVTKNPDKTGYNHNENVQLTAEASPTYEFDHWGGALSGDTNPKTIR
ncbi:LamG domain-containing protein [candidate division KSB1 bacterium]|nr:LamG domain-containing protein [candidate division KSB1 bacterium]